MKKALFIVASLFIIGLLGALSYHGCSESPSVEVQVDSLPPELTVPAQLTAPQDSI